MRAILVSALLLGFVTLVPGALAAEAGCTGLVCDLVNEVCGGCLGATVSTGALATSCSGEPCDTINRLCGGCIPATSYETDCMGPVCDAINKVCYRVGGAYCLG